CVYANAASCTGTYQGDWSVCAGVTYTSTSGTNAIDDISGTGQALTALDNVDDGNVIVTLAVPVFLYGNLRPQLVVSSNGLAYAFPGVTASYLTPAAIPTAALPNDMACALWMDLFPRTTLVPGAHVYIQQKT